MPRHFRLLLSGLLVLAALGDSACSSRKVDLAKVLKVTDVTTGWFDAGIVEGNKNKLVPTISLRLKNTDTDTLRGVQMIARFSRVGETEEWGSAPYVRAIGSEGLAPGRTSAPIVMKCDRGYTGEQPRAQMLANSQFVDARVELFAKYGSNSYVRLGECRIARVLLTH